MRRFSAKRALFTAESAFRLGATSQTTTERRVGFCTGLNDKLPEFEIKTQHRPRIENSKQNQIMCNLSWEYQRETEWTKLGEEEDGTERER